MIAQDIFESNDDDWKALRNEVEAALAAFHEERTRANLERVWAAQKAEEDYYAAIEAARPKPPPAPAEHAYRGEHEAPDAQSGAPLWNVCYNGIYPDDLYTGYAFKHYAFMDTDHAAISRILAYHNNPNAPVTIYRAVPKDLPKAKIVPGDWVTITRKYAVEHGRDNLKNNYRIISKTVFARDVFTGGDSASEWGYDPQPRVSRRSR